nr:30S ribosomal protein S5 [Mycoplasmopsis glycophila]
MQRKPRRVRVESEFSEKVVDIARVTKVVKGGRRFSFSAFVVVGNKKGQVGYGHGKANEVPDAIKKAIKDAQNNLVTVPVVNGTVPHETNAKFLASRVMLKPAAKGKGLIASGTVRAVVELAGYTDIVTKTYGSRSKSNIVKATVEALKALRTVEQIADIRDKKVKDFE